MNTHHPVCSRVYVIDDDDAVRDSVQWLLEGKGLQVQGFASVEEFLLLYDDSKPACMLVDIRMEGMSGLELQDKLLAEQSDIPLAFISGHGDLPMAVETMKKGACDFIQKPFDEKTLVPLVKHMLAQAAERHEIKQKTAHRDARLTQLTERERQVLDLIVDGRLNKQIANDLDISIKTVEAHRAKIMNKLGVNTITDLLKLVLDSTGG